MAAKGCDLSLFVVFPVACHEGFAVMRENVHPGARPLSWNNVVHGARNFIDNHYHSDTSCFAGCSL